MDERTAASTGGNATLEARDRQQRRLATRRCTVPRAAAHRRGGGTPVGIGRGRPARRRVPHRRLALTDWLSVRHPAAAVGGDRLVARPRRARDRRRRAARPRRAPPAGTTSAVRSRSTRATLRRVVGREGDPAAFVSIRPWIGPGVQLWLDDPEDPTPYWVISQPAPAARGRRSSARRADLPLDTPAAMTALPDIGRPRSPARPRWSPARAAASAWPSRPASSPRAAGWRSPPASRSRSQEAAADARRPRGRRWRSPDAPTTRSTRPRRSSRSMREFGAARRAGEQHRHQPGLRPADRARRGRRPQDHGRERAGRAGLDPRGARRRARRDRRRARS